MAAYFNLPYAGTPLSFGVDNDPANTGAVCQVPDPGVSPVSATLLCGEANGCTSQASVETLAVGGAIPITADAITSSADATPTNPNGCPTGTVVLVNANILGVQVPDVTPAPNTNVPLISDLGIASLVLNEQICEGGELVVRAVHLTIVDPVFPGTLLAEVILAESRAGNSCCPDCGLPAQ